MKSFEQVKKEVATRLGYNEGENVLTRKYIYYGYSNGEVYTYTNKVDAENSGFLVEKVLIPNTGYFARHNEYNDALYKAMHDNIRLSFTEVPDFIFETCYQTALKNYAESSWEEIVQVIELYTDLVMRCLKH